MQTCIFVLRLTPSFPDPINLLLYVSLRTPRYMLPYVISLITMTNSLWITLLPNTCAPTLASLKCPVITFPLLFYVGFHLVQSILCYYVSLKVGAGVYLLPKISTPILSGPFHLQPSLHSPMSLPLRRFPAVAF